MLERRPFTTNLAIDTCRLIKGVDMDIRATPGTALVNDRAGKAVFTPPEGASLLRDMLSERERHAHAIDDVDPLVSMAVHQFQPEAIHPFTDGDGRTGLILSIPFLVQAGLLDIPVLYLIQAASSDLETLVEIGVLEERQAGREKLFIGPALLRVL